MTPWSSRDHVTKLLTTRAHQLTCSSVGSVLDIRGFDLKRTLEMDPEFLNTDGSHEHDSSVTSLSIIQPGDVDLDAVQSWVGEILQSKGADIYRMKGVLSIADTEQKFVYQV